MWEEKTMKPTKAKAWIESMLSENYFWIILSEKQGVEICTAKEYLTQKNARRGANRWATKHGYVLEWEK